MSNMIPYKTPLVHGAPVILCQPTAQIPLLVSHTESTHNLPINKTMSFRGGGGGGRTGGRSFGGRDGGRGGGRDGGRGGGRGFGGGRGGRGGFEEGPPAEVCGTFVISLFILTICQFKLAMNYYFVF